MGFDAVWISPVVAQVTDPTRGYHGYSAQDLYALNSNFGSEADLMALSQTLHDRGMVGIAPAILMLLSTIVLLDLNLKAQYLMVDVVTNHMAYDNTAPTIDYSTLNPFNDESYFHGTCWISNENDQSEIEDVSLSGFRFQTLHSHVEH